MGPGGAARVLALRVRSAGAPVRVRAAGSEPHRQLARRADGDDGLGAVARTARAAAGRVEHAHDRAGHGQHVRRHRRGAVGPAAGPHDRRRRRGLRRRGRQLARRQQHVDRVVGPDARAVSQTTPRALFAAGFGLHPTGRAGSARTRARATRGRASPPRTRCSATSMCRRAPGWARGRRRSSWRKGVSAYGSVSQGFRAPNLDDLSTLGLFDFGVEIPAGRASAGALAGHGGRGEAARSARRRGAGGVPHQPVGLDRSAEGAGPSHRRCRSRARTGTTSG